MLMRLAVMWFLRGSRLPRWCGRAQLTSHLYLGIARPVWVRVLSARSHRCEE